MQMDFHYYATYCAAYLAGYSHDECQTIAYSANFVDYCSRSFLSGAGAPLSAATTQLSMELANARTDVIGLQDITRIWSSFHFLPFDLYADIKKGSKLYKNKYRLICNVNSDLLVETVNLAKDTSLQAVGVAMHVLADTWAHRYFAGTPSLVINNTNGHFYEIIEENGNCVERKISFKHSPSASDDPVNGIYSASLYQSGEHSIMNLGHGRAGHLPDYSYIKYKYLPAWDGYNEIIKDNLSDYYHAFCQMIHALKFLHGNESSFEKEHYDFDTAAPYREEIMRLMSVRRVDACEDWKALGERLSGMSIDDFDTQRYLSEYKNAPEADRDGTFLGRFILAALAQKSMVTNKIYRSGSRLAGMSVDFDENGFKGIKDFRRLVEYRRKKRNE